MEIHGTDGSITRIQPNKTTIFGRENLCNNNDSTVSRRHVSIDLISPNNQTKANPRVFSIEVIGKNPVWVYDKFGDKKLRTLKRFQRGELGIDDLFCVSGKKPVWFSVKEVKDEVFTGLGEGEDERLNLEGKLSESLVGNYNYDDDGEFGLDSVDVSGIDPVQEFGFLVIGHEFDRYPKSMIRDIKNWDWFLDDPAKGSDDDEEEAGETRGSKRGSRKRKKTGRGDDDDDVDEEWSADSEGDELTTKASTSKVGRPMYQTRSKENKRTNKNVSSRSSSKKEEDEEEDEDEDEEDETLGGFIIDDENLEEGDDEEEEEEEFVEDEDEMEE